MSQAIAYCQQWSMWFGGPDATCYPEWLAGWFVSCECAIRCVGCI